MKLSHEDVGEIEVLMDIAMATVFLVFYIWGAHWRHLANTTESSMCGGNEALSNYFDHLLILGPQSYLWNG